MPFRSTRALVPAVAALALLLSGCGGLSFGKDSAPIGLGPNPSASPTKTHDQPARPKAPKGQQWVTAHESQVDFLVPKAWDTMDLPGLYASLGPADAKTFAATFGYTVKGFRTKIQRTDLCMMQWTGGTAGENVVVEVLPQKKLPAAKALRADLASHQGHVVRTTAIKTKAGRGYDIQSWINYAGARGRDRHIYLQTDTRVVHITIAAQTDAKAASLAKRIRSSLRYTY